MCEGLALGDFRLALGHPKKSMGEVIRQDRTLLYLIEGMAHDQVLWMGKISVEG